MNIDHGSKCHEGTSFFNIRYSYPADRLQLRGPCKGQSPAAQGNTLGKIIAKAFKP